MQTVQGQGKAVKKSTWTNFGNESQSGEDSVSWYAKTIGWVSMMVLKTLRKQCDHPAQRT